MHFNSSLISLPDGSEGTHCFDRVAVAETFEVAPVVVAVDFDSRFLGARELQQLASSTGKSQSLMVEYCHFLDILCPGEQRSCCSGSLEIALDHEGQAAAGYCGVVALTQVSFKVKMG